MLWLAVGIANAAVLILEIVGARALTPFFGSSSETWAGLLSVVILGLALGYWGGGLVADRMQKRLRELLSMCLAAAGLIIIALWSGSDSVAVLGMLLTPYVGLTLASAVTALPLLFFPSIALAAVSPIAAKMMLASLDTSASVVGRLSAVAAVGSVVGSLGVGAILIPYFGSHSILMATGVVLLVMALAVARERTVVLGVLICMIASGLGYFANSALATTLADVTPGILLEVRDSRYGRILVVENTISGGKIRTIHTSPFGTQCGAYILPDGTMSDLLPFAYTRTFDAALLVTPDPARAAVIGGCNYSYPTHLSKIENGLTVDTVEIDPAMTELAKKWFGFSEGAVRPVHIDGRTFLRNTKESYDIIIADAFGVHITVPFELLTQEAFTEMHAALSERGVAAFNIIGSLTGPGDTYVASIVRTIESVFPNVTIYQIGDQNPSNIQNLLILASKGAPLPTERTRVFPHSDVLVPTAIPDGVSHTILTDEYAPVEALAKPMRDAILFHVR